MNDLSEIAGKTGVATTDRIIKLAVMAVGGQGGGVLGNWIEATARAAGYHCQATSVAGVAQRTGSTIYYIEMAPVSGDGMPIFSLAPSPGDVDIVIAAEMMEAGRAVLRGFVTPDRTTLIASSHRVFSIAEKMVPGDGRASADEVRAAAEIAAQRLILHDLDRMATDNGSVISASLFGALAGSGALPFERDAFEAAIRSGGKGVEPSLKAFAAAYAASQGANETGEAQAETPTSSTPTANGPSRAMARWNELVARIDALADPVQPMALAGLQKVVDYQSTDYGSEYLDRLEAVSALDDQAHGHQLTIDAAKYIANAMAYDDVIRVADLKTRGRRSDRIDKEMAADGNTVMHVTEFMHPRAEEIVGLMPARMGARWDSNPKAMARLDRWFNKGRRIRSDRLSGFLLLYILGGMRRWRLRTLRHAREMDHIEAWLQQVREIASTDYGLAVEIVRCRRLIKGYSDTHARGLSKYDRVLGAVQLLNGRSDGSDWLRRLREAALLDEKGEALDGALKTVASLD